MPAIVVGRAGLVVIDCDRHPGGNDGIKAFNSLLGANGGNLADVPMTRTARGGAHLFFRQPPGGQLGNGRGELPDGVDVRGAGGFVIAPGAESDGKRWQSANGRPSLADAFKTGTIPELPLWLADIIRPNPQPNRDRVDEYAGANSSLRGQAYAAAALQGAAAELSTAPAGKRNEMLNAMAFCLGRMIARGGSTKKPWPRLCSRPAMQTSICASTVIARQQKPSRVGLKPAGRSRTQTFRTATPHQAVTAHQILTFLTFPPYGAANREAATSC